MARNRITNFLYIFSQLKFISAHGDKLGCMFQNLVVEKEVRWGLFSKYFLKCEICNEIFKIENVDNDSSNIPDINDAAVKGIMSIGRGLDDLEKFLDSLDIPYMLPKRCDIGQQQVSPRKAIETEEEKLYNGNNNSSRKEQKSEEDPNTNLRSESKTNNEVPVKNCNYEATLKQEDIYIKDEIIEDESQPSTSFSPENVTTTVKEEIPEILEESCAQSVDLLPQTTKERYYQKEYEDFQEWRKRKNVKTVNEDVLLAYTNEKSEVYSPTSLWTKITMLKLALKDYDSIDISRYGKLFIFLRRKSDGYTPKKARILSEKEVTKFLLEADDHTWLLEKVVLMCGILGACKRDELVKLTVDDFESTRTSVVVTLRYTKNKKNRVFLIPKEGLPFNAYGLYKKYADLRPSNLETRRFFIGYRNGECVNKVVGKNTVGAVPKKIAAFLKLENPELYTGHSFRRSSTAVLVENGGDQLSVKEVAGCDSSTVGRTYIEKSVSKRMKITK